MGDLFDTLRPNAAATQDVGEERFDVSWPLGAAERDQQHGVEGA